MSSTRTESETILGDFLLLDFNVPIWASERGEPIFQSNLYAISLLLRTWMEIVSLFFCDNSSVESEMEKLFSTWCNLIAKNSSMQFSLTGTLKTLSIFFSLHNNFEYFVNFGLEFSDLIFYLIKITRCYCSYFPSIRVWKLFWTMYYINTERCLFSSFSHLFREGWSRSQSSETSAHITTFYAFSVLSLWLSLCRCEFRRFDEMHTGFKLHLAYG